MAVTRCARYVVVLACAGLLLGACSSSGGDKPTTAPPTPRTSTVPTSTTSTQSDPGSRAVREATAFVPSYLATLDRLYNNPSLSLNELHTVAIDPEFTIEATAIGKFRDAGDRAEGTQKLAQISRTSVHLSGLGGQSAAASYPAVELTACVDVSGTTAKDAHGRSIGKSSRPRYLVESLTIVNIKYPAKDGWRVTAAPNRQAASCAA